MPSHPLWCHCNGYMRLCIYMIFTENKKKCEKWMILNLWTLLVIAKTVKLKFVYIYKMKCHCGFINCKKRWLTCRWYRNEIQLIHSNQLDSWLNHKWCKWLSQSRSMYFYMIHDLGTKVDASYDIINAAHIYVKQDSLMPCLQILRPPARQACSVTCLRNGDLYIGFKCSNTWKKNCVTNLG